MKNDQKKSQKVVLWAIFFLHDKVLGHRDDNPWLVARMSAGQQRRIQPRGLMMSKLEEKWISVMDLYFFGCPWILELEIGEKRIIVIFKKIFKQCLWNLWNNDILLLVTYYYYDSKLIKKSKLGAKSQFTNLLLEHSKMIFFNLHL